MGGCFLDFEPEFWAAWDAVLPGGAGPVPGRAEELWHGAASRAGNVSELWSWLHLTSAIARSEATTLFGPAALNRTVMAEHTTAAEAIAVVRTQAAYLRLDRPRQQRLERLVADFMAAVGDPYPAPLYALLVTAPRRA